MLKILRSLISSLRHYWGNTNAERNEQIEERMYPQSYSTKYRYLDVEKWQKMCYSFEEEFTSQMDIIMAFDAYSALIKSKDDMVYGVGVNLNGRLGLLIRNHYYTKPEKVDALCGKNVISFHCSSDELCFYALTEEGKVYCWGTNENDRLNKVLSYHETYTPFETTVSLMVRMNGEARITHIACNNYNCFALGDNGSIYIWGFCNFTTEYSEDRYGYSKLSFEKKIVQIACGTSFVIALNDDGKLYCWGRNESGQLEIKDDCIVSLHQILITSLENVKIDKIVCGSEHSLVLTSEGKIYSWGNNCKGQLGHGEGIQFEREPVMLTESAMGIISDIAAQHDTSAAVSMLGSVYVWGFLRRIIWKPIRIECSNMHNVFRYKISCRIHDSPREHSNTLEHLKTIFDDQSTSDFTIEVEGKPIHVHKAILIRCDYFKNMLQHGWRGAKENIIKCNDFPYNMYKAFLKYLYTDVIDHLSLEEAFELLKLCDKYTEKTLAIKCMQMIEENINESNVALCCAKATECNAEHLVEYCVQFSSSQMSI